MPVASSQGVDEEKTIRAWTEGTLTGAHVELIWSRGNSGFLKLLACFSLFLPGDLCAHSII